jgi:hypothetical protein
MNCLRPFKQWDGGFESHLTDGCLYAFILFVQVAALRQAGLPSKESFRLCKSLRNWKSGQDPTEGCRAIDRHQLLTRGVEENHRKFSQNNRDFSRATAECKSALLLESTASHENSHSEWRYCVDKSYFLTFRRSLLSPSSKRSDYIMDSAISSHNLFDSWTDSQLRARQKSGVLKDRFFFCGCWMSRSSVTVENLYPPFIPYTLYFL